jgi:hypothetical protein
MIPPAPGGLNVAAPRPPDGRTLTGDSMGRIVIFLLIAAVIVFVLARSSLAARRRKAGRSELNKHPERLDQSLDPTDDA